MENTAPPINPISNPPPANDPITPPASSSETPPPQTPPSIPTQESEGFFAKHKRLLLLGGVFMILLGVAIASSFLQPSTQQNKGQNQLTPTGQASVDTEEATGPFNPLINNKELERVENAYRANNPKAPTPQKHQFDYKLAPELKKDKSSLLSIPKAYAATTCNIDTAPTTVKAYVLRNRTTLSEAQKTATEYSMSPDAASLPMNDGSSYQYYFADPSTNSFLTISEPSGMYYYHKAIVAASGNTSISNAQAVSDSELSKHALYDNTTLKNSQFDEGLKQYFFFYEKQHDVFKMTDTSSIKALGKTTSLCNVQSSITAGVIETLVNQAGTITKIVNKTRKIDKTVSMPRQNLEDSIAEYKASPPVPPIVIGASATPATAGSVTIDEAVLVWYDFGEQYAQITYLPMYLTSGKTASGDRVLTLFPAVAKSEIDKTSIPSEVNNSGKQLQLLTFNPKPTKAPAAPNTPSTPSTPNTPSTTDNKCFGGQVDYAINCTKDYMQVCGGFISVDASQYDKFNVCSTGCKNVSENITFSAGENPCKMYLEQLGLPTTIYKNSYPFRLPIGDTESGTAVCSVNACPC